MTARPVVRNYDRRTHKKCIKCRNWKPRVDILNDDGVVIKKKGFGAHNSSDGLQSICFACKNIMNTKSREKNVTARIRHHTATRCMTQLGALAPENFVRDLEDHLGYRIKALVRHLIADLKDREGHTRKLRDALNEGYHIDHVRPLSSYPVIVPGQAADDLVAVDWEAFKECWAVTNLSAIPAAENLAKGAKILGRKVDFVIFDEIGPETETITDEQKDRLKDWFDKGPLDSAPKTRTVEIRATETDPDETD